MKIISILVVFIMVVSSITTVQAVSYINSGKNISLSNLKVSDTNSALAPPTIDSSPISDWMTSENSYWQEQMKNDQLTQLLGSASNGINLSVPPVNTKVSQSYYTQNVAINIDVEKVFYKPGDQVNYIIQTTQNMQPVSTQLYVAIYSTANNFYYQYGGYYYQNSANIPLYTFTITTDQSGFYQGSFNAQNEGQYSLFVSQSSINQNNYYYGSNAYRVISVSNLAIYSRLPYYFIPSQPITGYSIILNGTNFQPISGAAVNISYYMFDWSTNKAILQNSWEGQTDSNGKVVFSVSTDFSSLYWGYLVITAKKGSFTSNLVRSIWSSYYYQQESGINFVPTLDKPIYQPGETIHARVLVWNNNYLNATKTPVSNQPITIQLLNPQSTLLFQFQRVTDDNGILSFDLPLDSSVPLGTYKLIFSKDNFQQMVQVSVDYYEKPAFQVFIDLNKQYVPDGQYATGIVFAQYYFGKPVTSSQVTLTLQNGNGQVKQTIQGTTDQNGNYTFSIKVTATSDEPSLNLIASVTDPVGRVVLTNTSIITVSDIYLGAWAYPYNPKPTDQVQVSFYAYQGLSLNKYYYSYYSWQPLIDQQVTIQIIGINSLLGGTTEIVKEIAGQTGTYGFGSVSFTLSQQTVLKYKSFQIYVTLSTDDGRSQTYTTFLQYAKYYTQISFDKQSYSVGSTVNMQVNVFDLNNNSATALVSISVFDADYDAVYTGQNNITGSSTYALKLSSYSPIGSYYVYTVISYNSIDQYGYVNYNYVYGGQNSFTIGEPETLNITTDKRSYNVGDTIKVIGSMTNVPQNPVYFEISKRGIVSVQSFHPNTTNFEIDLNNLETLAPKITLVFITILPNGLILESYTIIEINQKLTLVITSDKENYKPGDQATITIKLLNANNEPVDGIGVISLIDSSVYGVKADPEWESDSFNSEDYWSSMATATNWRGFQPIWYYYWNWFIIPLYSTIGYRGGIEAPVYSMTKDTISQSPSLNTNKITIRDNLPESMNWQPEVYISKSGYTFNTTLADTIGQWTIRVTATKGSMGVIGKETFITQLPFFVEMSKPAVATQDDIVSITGIFYNYLGQDINATVRMQIDNSLILNKETQSVRIPNNFLTSVHWSVYLSSFGSINVTIYAQTTVNGTIFSDALRKQLVITPNAVDESFVNSGIVSSTGTTIDLTQYAESVLNNQYLVISPGTSNVVLDSWQRLIGYPYGCLEQTMSKLLPDILVLQYLQSTNQLNDSIKNEIEQYIEVGISKIYSMQNPDGGFSWFADYSSNMYMTAYALYGLNELIQYNYTSNINSLKNALNYILANQYSDGHWSADYWYIDNTAFTAFIVRNLVQLNTSLSNQLSSSIANALNYIKSSWSSNQDPYTAALYLLATYGTSRYDATFGSELLNYILANQKLSNNQGIYWSVDDSSWNPLGGTTETTALVLQALILVNYASYHALLSAGINWLVQNQYPWGWSTTKGTAETLSALIDYLSNSTISNSGYVDVTINGKSIKQIPVSGTSDIQPFDVSNYLTVGSNVMILKSSTNTSFLYYFSSKQLLRVTPYIDFNDSIQVQPNTKFQIPFTLSLSSSILALKDVNFKLLGNNLVNNSPLTICIPFLDSTYSGSFSLQSGGISQSISITGIELDYSLISNDLIVQSPGKISQIFGPITVTVSNEAPTISPTIKLSNQKILDASQPIIKSQITTQVTNGLELQKTYSKTSNIKVGDFLNVNLNLKAMKSLTDQYFVIEDTIPSGFVIDETSLKQNSGLTSYSISGNSLALYISSLATGQAIQINYLLQAESNILASVANAASVSSMYNTSVKDYSQSFVLGNNLLKRDALGIIQRDVTSPTLSDFKYSIGNDQKINFQVIANDTDGIGQVIIYYKNKNWNSQELQSVQGNTFTGFVKYTNENKLTVYVQIQDVNGNNFDSNYITIDIPMIIINIVVIVGILLLTGIISVTGYEYSKKRLLTKDKK